MNSKKTVVTSGVDHLDRLLGGLNIGDNVVWYDDAGSLAHLFCRHFIRASRDQKKPLIYVSFDRSPKNLLENLGPLAENPRLTVLDCFTYGKGAGSEVFLEFYRKNTFQGSCQIEQVEDPRNVHAVMDAFYGVHKQMKGDVRFVFESLTGMQALWGGEEHITNFYSHSCPRLYELQTIAYWIIEKKAHSTKLRAKINQVAQVAIDLSVKRGRTSLTVLKAENRDVGSLNKPCPYWSKDQKITFDAEKGAMGRIDIGMRLKDLRTRKGLSQTEMSRLVGVTPSTISQVESNLIYPSLPALIKMAEVLSVNMSSFFPGSPDTGKQMLFPASDAVDVKSPEFPKKGIVGKLLTPVDFEAGAEPYLIEIPPGQKISSHFFVHKGQELGYLMSGKLRVHFKKEAFKVATGDTICLTSEIPTHWKNTGSETARLLWIKLK